MAAVPDSSPEAATDSELDEPINRWRTKLGCGEAPLRLPHVMRHHKRTASNILPTESRDPTDAGSRERSVGHGSTSVVVHRQLLITSSAAASMVVAMNSL